MEKNSGMVSGCIVQIMVLKYKCNFIMLISNNLMSCKNTLITFSYL